MKTKRKLQISISIAFLLLLSILQASAFSIGDHVQCTANLKVHATASTNGTLVTTEASGSQGTITSGPTSANGYTWWDISWNNGYSGWSVQDYLEEGQAPPTVQTLAASSVTTTSAQLNSTVNANGASTTFYYQWGTTTSYGNTTPTGSTSGSLTVNYSLTGLTPNTTYHYRIVASNSGGPSYGGDQYFTTSPSVNGLTIIPIFDSSITSDPQAATIEATINSAIAVYKNDFSDPVTVSIEFQEVTTGLGASFKLSIPVSYSDYITALVSHATTTDDATALAHLPTGTSNPVNGNQNVDLNYALARALGFSAEIPSVEAQTLAGLKISIVNPSASETVSSKDAILATLSHYLNQSPTNSTGSGPHPLTGQPDGTILLNTAIMNLSATQTDPTKYSLFSVVSHEIDEVLGFGSALNGLNNGDASPTGPVMPEDLFRYDQTGARSFTTDVNAASYFSIDGTTDIARFNQYQGGDFGDWYSYYGGQIPQVQDAYSTAGAAPVLGVELQCLDVIGFTRISSPVTINASAGSGGNISPNGSFSRDAGDNQTFTATPNSNYVIDQWLVDGSVVQNGGTSYTLYNIQVGHSVQVTFTYVPPQYTINASAGSGGSISPSGSFTKNAGDSQPFTATPNANYTVNQWLVDSGVVQTGGNSYSLNNIQSAHSVQVTFTHASSPIASNPKLTGTTFTLSVPTQIGFNYILEYKNSLSDTSWTPVQTIGGTGGTITLTDTTAADSSRFYHVRVQ
jgi:Divergent InlB B-repeat domain